MLLNFRRSSKLVFLVLFGLFGNNILLAVTAAEYKNNNSRLLSGIETVINDFKEQLATLAKTEGELKANLERTKSELDTYKKNANKLQLEKNKIESEARTISTELEKIKVTNKTLSKDADNAATLKKELLALQKMYDELAKATEFTFEGLEKLHSYAIGAKKDVGMPPRQQPSRSGTSGRSKQNNTDEDTQSASSDSSSTNFGENGPTD